MSQMGLFAKHIMETKYSHVKPDGTRETWDEIARRVAENVMGAVSAPEELINAIQKVIAEKKFIPGGRYLYASGRPYHQTNNCYEGRTEVVTRWGTKTFKELAGSKAVLMTSNGNWVEAEIRSFGKQELMEVVLMRAGVKKTLYATPGHSWRIQKNQTRDGRPAQKREVQTSDLRKDDRLWMVFGYGINRTPISPDGIRHGVVWGDGCVNPDEWGFSTARVRLCGHKKDYLLRFFPEYNTHPIDNDIEVTGLPRLYKKPVTLDNDRSYLLGWLSGYLATDGCVDECGGVTIASTDEESLKLVKDVCYVLGIGAYGIVYTDRVSNLTGSPSRLFSVGLMREHLTPEFFLNPRHRERFSENPVKRKSPGWRVESVRLTDRVEEVFCAVVPDTHEFVLADNILTGNCLLLSVEDSREGWAELLRKSSMALMTGAGIGVNYSRVRAEGEPIMKTGGTATGPLALMQMVNEVSRGVIQGGSRRSAVLAILSWKHPDIYKYIVMKNWPDHVKELKGKDVNFPATMDGTNISVQLDDEFFEAYHNTSHTLHSHASSVYWAVIEQMLKTGEPGFTVDVGVNHGETLRNAPVSADTKVLTINGYVKVGDIIGVPVIIWTGSKWVGSVVFEKTFENAPIVKVTLDNGRFIKCEPHHEFVLSRGWPRGLERVEAQHLKIGDVCFAGILSDEVPDGGKVVTVVGIEYPEEREDVYCCNVGVEEHSFMAEGVIISNCGEITSSDGSDICIAKGTPVLTERGWKPIEDITVEDSVAYINDDGVRCYEKPTFSGLSAKEAETIKITTSTGATLSLTANHRVSVSRDWVMAGDLKVGDPIDTEEEVGEIRTMTRTKEYDDWFSLGWLVGGGWDLEDRSLGVCAGKDKTYPFGIVSGRLGEWKAVSDRWGLKIAKSPEKELPQTVWLASREDKAAFLAGLFANDGTVKTNRNNVILSSSSRKIRDGVRLLLAELGIRSWTREYQVAGRNRQGVVVVNGASAYRFAEIVGFGHHIEKNNRLREKLKDDKRNKLTKKDVVELVSLAGNLSSSALALKFNISASRCVGHGLRRADRITAIEKGPKIDVYDLTMPTGRSFIANTLRVHNCNLGAINIARIASLEEMKRVVELGTAFLLAGTVYSDVPYEEVRNTRNKNRRLGLGFMGLHEWLIKRGKPYGPDEELGKYLEIYAGNKEIAIGYADAWGLSRPVKTRAIAPTGTTGIVAETTTGIEPVFCAAYKRRYRKGSTLVEYQYVLDPTAKRLVEGGINPDVIEDAYTLAESVERRVAFQAWVQKYIDHGLSSTINLPAWGTEFNNHNRVMDFGNMLIKYLPQLRGITAYPDGARSGQPLTPVKYHTAAKHVGQVFVETVDVCDLKGGSCGG